MFTVFLAAFLFCFLRVPDSLPDVFFFNLKSTLLRNMLLSLMTRIFCNHLQNKSLVVKIGQTNDNAKDISN